MRTIEKRQYKMLTRVRDFGNTRRDVFQESSPAGQQFGIVAEAVKQLSEQAMANTAAAGERASTKARGQQALIDRLEAISRTARVIAEGTPGLEDKFHLPDPQTDEALLTAGGLVATRAARVQSGVGRDRASGPVLISIISASIAASSVLPSEARRGVGEA